MAAGFEIPEWAHLIPAASDDAETLRSKTSQLETLAQGLRRLVEAARDLSGSEEAGPGNSGVMNEVAGGGGISVTDMGGVLMRRDSYDVSAGVQDPMETEDGLDGDESERLTEEGQDVVLYGSDPIEETSPSSKGMEGEALQMLDKDNTAGFMMDSKEGDPMEAILPQQEGNERIQEAVDRDLDDDLPMRRRWVVDNARGGSHENERTDCEPNRECVNHTTETLEQSVAANKDAYAGPQGAQEDDAGLMMELGRSIESTKMSHSGRYVFVVVRSKKVSDHQLGFSFLVWDLGFSFSSPPLSLGAFETAMDVDVTKVSINHTWDVSEARNEPLLAISTSHHNSSSIHKADAKFITCLSIQGNLLNVQAQLETEIDLHCVVATNEAIIAAGVDGQASVWNVSSLSQSNPEMHDLPQAHYRHHPFDTICELKVPEGRTGWVVGVSSRGSVVLWDYKRLEVLTTVHHSTYQLSDLHFLPAENPLISEEDDTNPLAQNPLAFIGTLVERENQKAQKSVAAILLRKDVLNVGCSFPIEGVQQLYGCGGKGLLSTREGKVTAWDIIQGKLTWRTRVFFGKKVRAIWMGCENFMIAVGTQCGCLLLQKLAAPLQNYQDQFIRDIS